MLTVVIDPGHGSLERIGSSSPNNSKGSMGTLEKNVTLEIALATRRQMPSDIEDLDKRVGWKSGTLDSRKYCIQAQ